MSGPLTALPDAAADARWSDWMARGAESDRRSALTMQLVFAVVFAAVVGWLSIQVL